MIIVVTKNDFFESIFLEEYENNFIELLKELCTFEKKILT